MEENILHCLPSISKGPVFSCTWNQSLYKVSVKESPQPSSYTDMIIIDCSCILACTWASSEDDISSIWQSPLLVEVTNYRLEVAISPIKKMRCSYTTIAYNLAILGS